VARPLRIIYPGALYHITARGNEKKDIFRSDQDRGTFLTLLAQAVARYRLTLHAYVLMNNHYHLLLETSEGNLPLAIRHLNGVYTGHFNRTHGRVGHLFQGRYKAIVVEKESYLLELSRYIHLNPFRVERKIKIDAYLWSSYLDYVGKRKAPGWLTIEAVLNQFDKTLSTAQRAYRAFVEEGARRGGDQPWENVVGQVILGGKEFLRSMQEKVGKGRHREVPSRKHLEVRPTFEEIQKRVQEILPELQFLKKGPRSNPERTVVCYLGREKAGMSLRALSKHFGVDDSAVSQGARRLANLRSKDRKLNQLLDQIEKKLISNH
jgi:REP element-mobilizing transposase RayT